MMETNEQPETVVELIEASILTEHKRIKIGMDNVIKLKKRGPVPGTQKRVYDYKWLPKQTHDYVDR